MPERLSEQLLCQFDEYEVLKCDCGKCHKIKVWVFFSFLIVIRINKVIKFYSWRLIKVIALGQLFEFINAESEY